MRPININHLLEQYFLLHRDMVTSTPLGRDPTASRVPSSDFSRPVGLMCDVGMCLEQLSAEHRRIIIERWTLWLSREDADVMVTNWSQKAASAMRANNRGARKRAQKEKEVWRQRTRVLSEKISKASRANGYIQAIEQFRVEVISRDIYARAVRGESAKIA